MIPGEVAAHAKEAKLAFSAVREREAKPLPRPYATASELRTAGEVNAVYALMFLLGWDGES